MTFVELLHREQLKNDKRKKTDSDRFLNQLLEDTNVIVKGDNEVINSKVSLYAEPVFDKEVIKSVCVNLRLRFLRSGAYKGSYPTQATNLVEVIAEDSENFTGRFYVMAPAHFFNLSGRRSTPILFAERIDGRFQLMYQWGNKVSWLRLLLNYPFRNFISMFLTCASVGLLSVLIFFAMDWLHADNWLKNILIKIPVFVLITGFCLIVSVIYGLITYTDFSEDNWYNRRLKPLKDGEK